MSKPSYSVLLIEDEALDAKQLKRRLQGHEGAKISVTHVESLEEALAVLALGMIDVSLIDLNLPDSQGVNTVRRVITAAPQVAAIVLSGQANDETAKQAVREGAQDYIVKNSIHHVDVLKCIEFAIERQRVADELRHARDREKQHAQFKSDFLAQMSHEIRTPMNGVVGMTSLLLASPALSPEDRERVEIIKSSGDSLLAILNDILDLSKIEAGKITLQESAFNVRHLIEDCLETFAQTASARQITLTNLILPEVPRQIRSDPQRLRQILTNLISNALKFTDRGHVCVTASIDVSDPQQLHFEVTDTGLGISPGKQAKLFVPFVQAELNHQFSGTGLGLTICKNLAELMGGRIGVKSSEGQGSCFWFSINFAKDAEEVHEARPSFADHHVLVFGLSAATNQLLQSQLQLRGFGDVSCTDSLETVRSHSAHVPGLVLVNTCGLSPGDRQACIALAEEQKNQAHCKTILLVFDDTIPLAKNQILRLPLRQSILYRSAAQLLVPSPAASQPSQSNLMPKARSLRSAKALDVLVVDDGEVNRKVAKQMLKALHHRVESAEDGTAALALLAAKKYALVFMDCQMPGLSGMETTRCLRESQSVNAATPVIALTAHAFPEDRMQCLAAGMDDFLTKPVVLEDMARIIARWGETCHGSVPVSIEAQLAAETPHTTDLPTRIKGES